MSAMEATLIQNGLLYDGTLENPPVTGELLIRGDRIAAMGPHIDCIGDNATFDHGKRLSTGMDLVFVNGQLAWKDETRLCRAGVLLH